MRVLQIEQHGVGLGRVGILGADPEILGDPLSALFDHANRGAVSHLELFQFFDRLVVHVEHHRLAVIGQQFHLDLLGLRIDGDDPLRHEVESVFLHAALRTDLNELHRSFICHDVYPLHRNVDY